MGACSAEPVALDPTAGRGDPAEGNFECSIPTSQIVNGGPGKDRIPALTDPLLTSQYESGASYLRDGDRVIGIVVDGQPLAVPLNILWWHEIVNIQIGDYSLAVTHCPLTGSSLVFDRGPLNDVEFGVSGLLYQNNLLMYDRSSGESLWPQMARGARCGPRDGVALAMLPAIEATWAGWKSLHPGTFVVSSETGHSANYRLYPYGRYDEPTNPELLFPLSSGIDGRRPPKERVLGIPESDGGGLAVPFGSLRQAGNRAVVELVVGGRELVIFWDAAAEGAMAYEPILQDGRRLHFRVSASVIVDQETGSAWRLDGEAASGALLVQRLKPVAEAYVAYWFAWAAFHPHTRIWPNG
jgi:hypothetical protein